MNAPLLVVVLTQMITRSWNRVFCPASLDWRMPVNRTPSRLTHDHSNVGLRNSELVPQSLLRNITIRVTGSDFENLLFVEFRENVSLAFAICVAAFASSVCVVLVTGAKPEVIGIHASRNVTAMKNTGSVISRAFWNRTVGQFPTETMRGAVFLHSEMELTVAMAVQTSIPKPTFGWIANGDL